MLAARRVLRGEVFDLHYAMHSGDTGRSRARLGLVIPKRLARRAVLRNAIKRQAREAFRSMSERVPAADLVLRLAKPAGTAKGSRQAGKSGWRAEVVALLQRLPASSP